MSKLLLNTALIIHSPTTRAAEVFLLSCLSTLFGEGDSGRPALFGWSFLPVTLVLTEEIQHTRNITDRLFDGLYSVPQTVSEPFLLSGFCYC